MQRILIAEDSSATRELLREILTSCGYDVVEACDGREALEKIDQTGPDVVLLDIKMPVLDGFAVLRQLRQDPCHARRLVVALTAYAMRGDRERMLEAGFDAYLSKPINPAALRVQIKQLLAQSRTSASVTPG